MYVARQDPSGHGTPIRSILARAVADEENSNVTDFEAWCGPAQRDSVNGHELSILIAVDHDAAVAAVAAHLPSRYSSAKRLAKIAKRNNKPRSAHYLRRNFPASKIGRSGDMGEILGTAFLAEDREFVVGPSRLISRDHKELAMRGDDILGARLDADGHIDFFKGEAKSRETASASTVTAARAGLDRESGLPSPHSLTHFADRLSEADEDDLAEAIEDALLASSIRPSQVTHMIFVLSGNRSEDLLRADLEEYAGEFAQHSVAVVVDEHQRFIHEAYEKAIADGA